MSYKTPYKNIQYKSYIVNHADYKLYHSSWTLHEDYEQHKIQIVNMHLYCLFISTLQASEAEVVGDLASTEADDDNDDDNDDVNDDVTATTSVCSVTSESCKTPLRIAGYSQRVDT